MATSVGGLRPDIRLLPLDGDNEHRVETTSSAAGSGGEHRSKPYAQQRAGERGRAVALQAKYAKPGTHKWRPEQRFIISSEEDHIIRNAALCDAAHRGVPARNRLSFKSLGKKTVPLSRVDLSCRITLHGHGSRYSFERKKPDELARELYDAGLREVGVIKLKSCGAGKGRYLVELRNALQTLDVKVGYISGPLGDHSDIRCYAKILGKEFAIHWFPFFAPQRFNLAYAESDRLRVVQGNADVSFPGTRYTPRKQVSDGRRKPGASQKRAARTGRKQGVQKASSPAGQGKNGVPPATRDGRGGRAPH